MHCLGLHVLEIRGLSHTAERQRRSARVLRARGRLPAGARVEVQSGRWKAPAVKVSEQLDQMERELKGLATALIAGDETGWAISSLQAAEAVQKLRHAFDHNWIGESEQFPPTPSEAS